MFNRTLLTTSANFARLNLGTRSLAGMAGANVGTTPCFRTSYPHVRTVAPRLGFIDDQGDPAISWDSPWSPAIPSLPAVSVRAVPVLPEVSRVVVAVAELPPGQQAEVVQPDVPPCRPAASNAARRVRRHRHATNWAAPRSAKAAAKAKASFGKRGDRSGRFPRTAIFGSLTAPDALTASGG